MQPQVVFGISVRKGAIMASNVSRTMIAALQVSLDGFTQGPHGEKDWVDSWADAIGLSHRQGGSESSDGL
jgi:hypothetical protein